MRRSPEDSIVSVVLLGALLHTACVFPPPITSPDGPLSYGLDRGVGAHCDTQEGQHADAYDDCRTDSASMKPCESAAPLPLLPLALLAKLGIDWAQEAARRVRELFRTLRSIGRRKKEGIAQAMGVNAGEGAKAGDVGSIRSICCASAGRYSVRNMRPRPTDGSSNLSMLVLGTVNEHGCRYRAIAFSSAQNLHILAPACLPPLCLPY